MPLSELEALEAENARLTAQLARARELMAQIAYEDPDEPWRMAHQYLARTADPILARMEQADG